MEMAMGSGTSEIWAAPSLKVDPDLLNTMGMSMMAGRSGFEEFVKEMRKVDGVPVYSVHHTSMMGATVETTSTLLEFKDDAKAPEGTFDIPAGYTQKDMPSMGDMGQ